MSERPTLSTIQAQLRQQLPFLQQHYHIRSLEIFGSYATGRAQEHSDLDLLVSFEELPTLLKFIEMENYISDLIGIPVDLVMEGELKPRIGERVRHEAVPV